MTAQAYLARLMKDLKMVTSEPSGGRLARSHISSEAPLRIHERGVDDGHGLGSPPFHQGFLAYLRASGVCLCDPHPVTGDMRHHCDRREATRLRPSDKHMHPRRLKRALRQVRAIDPASHDVIYLLVARGWSWAAMAERINGSRVARGQDPYTEQELSVFAMAGADILIASF